MSRLFTDLSLTYPSGRLPCFPERFQSVPVKVRQPARVFWRRASAGRDQRCSDRAANYLDDADWLRTALADRGITACIPSKVNRKVPIPHNTALYRRRHKIENMFGRLKDRRRIHTRYDRCAHTFMSAICIAAAVIFWL